MKKLLTGMASTLGLVLSVSAGLPSGALAGVASGQVTHVAASHDAPGGPGLFYVTVANGVDYPGRPECNTQGRFVINPAWPGGKYAIAVAIAALHSGRSVTAYGQGNCSLWGDSETLGYIQEY